jgi:hypothetical protein
MVSIKATDGSGHPTGDDLTSGTIDGNSLSTTPTWYEIALTEYTLSAHTKYAIVVRAPNGNDLNLAPWRWDESSPTYAGGNREYSWDSGDTWDSSTSVDLMFEVWGTDITPPPTVTVNVTSVVGTQPSQAEKDAFALLGDINRDGAIDWSDFMPLISAMGSVPGDANWNPACDLNKDGKITIVDTAICAHNYGTTILAGEESHVSCKIRKSTGELVKEFTTPGSVLLDVGEYVAYAGGQTKKFIIRDSDVGPYALIFYLLPTAEFPWWILGLIAAGVVLAVVVSKA